jgi:hypothetical protein
VRIGISLELSTPKDWNHVSVEDELDEELKGLELEEEEL